VDNHFSEVARLAAIDLVDNVRDGGLETDARDTKNTRWFVDNYYVFVYVNYRQILEKLYTIS